MAGPDDPHRRGRAVLLVVGVQQEEDVQRLDHHRVDLEVLAGRLERHPQEVRHVAPAALRADHVLAEGTPVRVRRDRRGLGQEQDGGELDRRRVERVDALGVVAGQGGDRAGEDGHRVGVRGERADERLEVVVQVGVPLDALDPGGELGRPRELTVGEQVGDLEEGRVLGELVDRVAAVEQHALVAVDVGDGRLARGGVHEAGVDRDRAGLLEEGRHDDAVVAHRGGHHREPEGTVADVQLRGRCAGLAHLSSSRAVGLCRDAPSLAGRGGRYPAPAPTPASPSSSVRHRARRPGDGPIVASRHARSRQSKADAAAAYRREAGHTSPGRPPARQAPLDRPAAREPQAPLSRLTARATSSSEAVSATRTCRVPAGP